MKRTQIYIDENTYGYLEKESRAKGATISEIIRESIKEKMNRKVQRIIKTLEDVSGVWKDRDFDVDGYIRVLRKDRKL
ncbi:MAG: ribbon-helix-helix protein, CopG family [Nitrospirae bacterium]|nr:ribbon-helix-helix protein, CopG family [Nitrospirota bacterium]